MGLHQLLYTSRPHNVSHQDVEQILVASRSRNPSCGISGTLMFTADWFIQVIEGKGSAITKLFSRISQDPRHTDLELRLVRPIDERSFVDWGMDYVSSAQIAMSNNRRFLANANFDPTTMSSETLIRFAAHLSENGNSAYSGYPRSA